MTYHLCKLGTVMSALCGADPFSGSFGLTSDEKEVTCSKCKSVKEPSVTDILNALGAVTK